MVVSDSATEASRVFLTKKVFSFPRLFTLTTTSFPLLQSMATTEDVSFAQGMFVTLWPKVERCHDYIELLLSAQEKLQHTVDQLIAGKTALGIAPIKD